MFLREIAWDFSPIPSQMSCRFIQFCCNHLNESLLKSPFSEGHDRLSLMGVKIFIKEPSDPYSRKFNIISYFCSTCSL